MSAKGFFNTLVYSTKFAARNGHLADALHPAKLVPYLCDHVTQGGTRKTLRAPPRLSEGEGT